MLRKIAFWGATGLVAIEALLAGFFYLTSAPQAVENFRHVGYPQQLRVLLGVAKLAGAIVLLLPRLPTLKEWAYAGFTFMWIAAVVAHYLAGDGALVLLPIALLGALSISYEHALGDAARLPGRAAAVPRGIARTPRDVQLSSPFFARSVQPRHRHWAASGRSGQRRWTRHGPVWRRARDAGQCARDRSDWAGGEPRTPSRSARKISGNSWK